MRILILSLSGAFLFSGCAKIKSWLPDGPSKNASVTSSSSSPVTTTISHLGKVAMLNPSARFVVITFPIGGVPDIERRLNVYRDGLKVAELKVTGPQRDNNTVADIVAGEPRVNDAVRPD